MDGHHLYGEAEPGVAPAELAAVAEELAKTSSKVLCGVEKLFVCVFLFFGLACCLFVLLHELLSFCR